MRHFTLFLALMVFLFARESIAQTSDISQDPYYACAGPGGGSTGGQQCKLIVCSGDTATYTINVTGDTYSWNIFAVSGPSPIVIGGNTSPTFTVYYPSAGNYVLEVLITSGGGGAQGGGGTTTAASTFICAVEGVIADFTTSYPVDNGCISICKNTTVTFYNNSSANTTTSVWNFGDGSVLVTAGAGPVTHTYTTPGTYTVTLTAKTECCTDVAELCVIVDAREGPDIYCVSQICGDDAGVQYCTNATCTSYDWSIIPASAGTIVSGAGTGCITVDWGPGPDAALSLLCNDPNACPLPTIVDVPIMPSAGFTISGPTTVCIGSTHSYSAPYVPGSQLTWTLTNPCTMTTTTLPYNTPPYNQPITFNCAGTYILNVSLVNDVLDCTASSTLVINAVPGFSVSGPDSLCAGAMGTFSAVQNFMPFNCNWTTSPSVGSATNTSSASFVFPTAGTYTITAVPAVPGSSCLPSVTKTVVVVDPPPMPTITGPSMLCSGTPYSFSASGSGSGVTYLWNATPMISVSPSTGANVNVTAFMSGALIVIPTNSFGCSGPAATHLVNLYTLPTPTISGPTTACPDDQLAYSATLTYPGVSTVNWTISPATAGTVIAGQGTPNPTIEWHSIIPNATQTATVTMTETICGTLVGSSNTLTVTIHPTPTPSSSDIDICIGGTATFTVSGGTGSTFDWYTASSVFVGSGSTITVSSPGNYYVTETDINGCKANDYVQANAYPQPIVTIALTGSPTCDSGGNMTNTVTMSTFNGTGYSFNWSGPGIVGSNTGPSITVNAIGTYTVVVTNSYGCTLSKSRTIACSTGGGGGGGGGGCGSPCTCTPGTPVATPNGPYCDDYTFTASGATCSNIQWSFGDGQFASGATVTHQYAGPGVYEVSYFASDPGCCGYNSTEITVTVPAIADFTHVVNCTNVCFNDNSAFLPAYSITNWDWNFGDGNTSTATNPCHTYAVPGTYTVTLEITLDNGCKAIVTKSVTAIGPNISATVQPVACNQPVNFTGTVISGNVVEWDWDFGNGQGSNSQNAQHTYTVAACTTYTPTLTATDGNGCSYTVSSSILVCPPPAPFSLMYTSPGCGSVSLDAGPGYVTYQWLLNGVAIPGANSQVYVATSSGTYTCQVTDANQCLITSNPATVTVNPLPPLNVTVSPNPICSNTPITLSSGLTGSYMVTWFDGFMMPVGSGLSLSLGTLMPGPYTYSATATDMFTGCTASQTVNFVVEPAPSVTITNSNPSGICSPNTITLTAIGAPPTVNYLWDVGVTTPALTVFSSGTFSVTVTDPANGCQATASATATVFPKPDLSMLPIGCASGCINPDADTIHGPPGLSSYLWTINGVPVATTQNIGLTPALMPAYNVPYIIGLHGVTTNGCMDSTFFEYTPIDCDPNCGCLGWQGNLTVQVGSTTHTLSSCGATINGFTGELITFNGTYGCGPNQSTCNASYTWKVFDASMNLVASGSSLPVSFTPAAAGTYTLNVYPTCGASSACEACIITFNISDPPPVGCECGTWGTFTIVSSYKTTYNHPCGGPNVWSEPGYPITVTGAHNCVGSCSATYTWKLKLGGVTIASGSGMPIVFTPTTTGTHTLTITPTCGSTKCGKCKITFKVVWWMREGDVQQPDMKDLMLRLQPNPASDRVQVTFTAPRADKGYLVVVNDLGVTLRTIPVELSEGVNTFDLNVADIRDGWYAVRYIGTALHARQQLVITR